MINQCIDCTHSNNFAAYTIFTIAVTYRVTTLSSLVTDLLLILYRYLEIVKKKTFLSRLSKILNILICYSVSFLLLFPVYFSTNVIETKTNGTFKSKLNIYGKSVYFHVYLLVLFLFENFIPLIVLVYLSILSVINYKRLMTAHANLAGNQSQARKSDHCFTIMVLLLSSITSVVRLIDLVTSFLFRLSFTFTKPTRLFQRNTLHDIHFSKYLSVLIINLNLAFDLKFNKLLILLIFINQRSSYKRLQPTLQPPTVN